MNEKTDERDAPQPASEVLEPQLLEPEPSPDFEKMSAVPVRTRDRMALRARVEAAEAARRAELEKADRDGHR